MAGFTAREPLEALGAPVEMSGGYFKSDEWIAAS